MSYLTIHREYASGLTKEEIQERLTECVKSSKVGKFYCKKKGQDIYKISARFSVGTLHFSGGLGGLAINALVDLSNAENGKLQIRTKVRVEHYFIAIVLLIMIFTSVATGGFNFVHLSGVTFIMVITHLWFHLVYRVQENRLIQKVVDLLKLTKQS